MPGAKYCVTRQWPLPREQCEVIDAFFAEEVKSGIVRESKSPHLTPTFCVRKPNGKWRLVHAYNKLNNATVSAQTLIPHKDVLLNIDRYHQILMRESEIPLTTVSTPSGILWVWLVMPQGLSNTSVTFNRLVTHLFRTLRTFAQTYFDDKVVHSRAEGGQTAMEVHLKHLRRVFEAMKSTSSMPASTTEEIKTLGCLVSRVGVRADPGKAKANAACPTEGPPEVVGAGFADLARPLSDLLKKNAPTGSNSTRMLSVASRRAYSMRQSWPCRTKISHSASFVTLLTMQ
ncbi:Pol protein [Phytophthora palmivora]|uniref:Pol protein n=1 Tax=Phytophthora palmivora TaxID=4796 RepID=A0A2P4Y7E8_9STRA|nr:Pol protein [Phytophthora palmivora]